MGKRATVAFLATLVLLIAAAAFPPASGQPFVPFAVQWLILLAALALFAYGILRAYRGSRAK